jgi:hypothetical protein
MGNQMFQCAAARRLAAVRNTSLQFDMGLLAARFQKPGVMRPYALAPLNIGDIAQARGLAASALQFRRRIAKSSNFGRWLSTYHESSMHFDPAVLEFPDGILLAGFFQCEKYFRDVADIIRAEFQPRDAAVMRYIADTMKTLRRPGRALVSVHVRRGDYLVVDPTGSLLVSRDRIMEAMARFRQADYLIFSDDSEWCCANLHRDGVIFSPFSSPLEDMTAMSLCDHNIIANSSFSWWGAWLNASPDKRVLAPVNWFGPMDQDGDDTDIYVENWERY